MIQHGLYSLSYPETEKSCLVLIAVSRTQNIHDNLQRMNWHRCVPALPVATSEKNGLSSVIATVSTVLKMRARSGKSLPKESRRLQEQILYWSNESVSEPAT